MDFGSPFGDHFGSLFDIFCHLKHQKTGLDCRHDFWWFLNGKSCDFWCPNLSKVWQILMFSLDFTFSGFSWFWWLFEPHFGHFWESWETNFMNFWYIGGSLKFQWISGSHQRHPKLRAPTWVMVNWSSRGYSRTVTNPRLLICRAANSRLITTWLVNCWFVNGNCWRLINWWWNIEKC